MRVRATTGSELIRRCPFLLVLLVVARGLKLTDQDGCIAKGNEDAALREAELPDDALEMKPKARKPLLQPDLSSLMMNASGYDVAQAWQRCPAWSKHKLHRADVVASLKHRFLFLENVKAGSTSVRSVLNGVLNRSWFHTDIPHNRRNGHVLHKSGDVRTTSKSFSPETIASLFSFSLVRDPVEKFESGVREAFAHGQHTHMTADEFLEQQLSRAHGWVNEHIMPSSFRLSALTSDGKMPHLDFIGKVENIEADWAAIVKEMSGTTREEQAHLLTLSHSNSRVNDNRSKLSPAGIRRMCQSEMYGSEWACFDYPLPEACK